MKDSLQVYVRCGHPLGSVAVNCSQADTVRDVKDILEARSRCLLGPAASMRLLYAGKQLQDQDVLSLAVGCASPCGATVQLSHRLVGGGGDGGSTGAESRSCYLEMYLGKKVEKVNPAEGLYAKWTRCHLSGEPLSVPVVVDELGNLFNKDAVLHALLHKTMPPALAYISSLKHVTELRLESNKGGGGASASAPPAKKGAAGPSNDSQFCCPVTGVEFNGKYKFTVFRSTGHVVSDKAIKDAPAVVRELVGLKSWGPEELLPINPVGETLDALREAVAARIAADREKRKSKKGSKAAAAGEVAVAAVPATGDDEAAAAGALPGCREAGVEKPVGASAAVAAAIRAPAAAAVAAAPAAAAAAAAAAALPGRKRPSGAYAPPAPAGDSKRAKPLALETMPKHATKEIYAGLFSSSVLEPQKETYCCRSTSARGIHLT